MSFPVLTIHRCRVCDKSLHTIISPRSAFFEWTAWGILSTNHSYGTNKLKCCSLIPGWQCWQCGCTSAPWRVMWEKGGYLQVDRTRGQRRSRFYVKMFWLRRLLWIWRCWRRRWSGSAAWWALQVEVSSQSLQIGVCLLYNAILMFNLWYKDIKELIYYEIFSLTKTFSET